MSHTTVVTMCVGCQVKNAERFAEQGIDVGDMGAYITRQVTVARQSTYASGGSSSPGYSMRSLYGI